MIFCSSKDFDLFVKLDIYFCLTLDFTTALAKAAFTTEVAVYCCPATVFTTVLLLLLLLLQPSFLQSVTLRPSSLGARLYHLTQMGSQDLKMACCSCLFFKII